jgi:hypothetical protein
MGSRALSLATVLLSIGSWAVGPAEAQENLDAGKTPSQIFAGTCNACHRSPRGLLKTVSPSSLPGFLRQHYTTSPNMAGVLASYLISNGATDARLGGEPQKGAKGAKEGTKQEARQEPPRSSGTPEQLDRWGRRIHAAPQEAAAPAAEPRPEAETPAQAAFEHGPDGRKMSPKQKLSKRGKPGEPLPKEEPATSNEPPKAEEKPSETAAKEEGKPETKPETAKPAEEGRSQSAKIEQPVETPAVRPDPVPPVTPAPPTPAASPTALPTEPANTPAAASTSTTGPLASPTASNTTPAAAQAAVALPATEMAVPLPPNAVPAPPPPPAVTASAPPLPPVTPAGPPAPPISQ